MPNSLRLIIWDTAFFLILSAGYAGSQAIENRTISYIVIILTCAVCGILLARLSIWGIYWKEVVFVGLPSLYLAVAPLIAPFVNNLSFISFPLVPSALLKNSAMILHISGAVTAGFVFRHVAR